MIKLEKVSKKFGTGEFGLSDISLSVEKGEFIFLIGTTGAGKTTLFRLLIRDLMPTEGKVFVNGFDLVSMSKSKLSELRKIVGVVFQDLKLLNDRTIFENVVLPLELVGENLERSKEKVDKILKQVGLLEHKDKFPRQLSGGELQRTAIARALVLSPKVILADEPTGNLDASTSWEIVKILSDVNKEGTTVIMATHNTDIVKSMDRRVIHIEKGKIVKDEKGKQKPERKERQDKKE